jgi:hypothetical protein
MVIVSVPDGPAHVPRQARPPAQPLRLVTCGDGDVCRVPHGAGGTPEHGFPGARPPRRAARHRLPAKARLEAAMDERLPAGEDGYRRRLAEVRLANPQRPGRPIEPFGLTKVDEIALVSGNNAQRVGSREALGGAVRRYTNTDGRTAKKPYRDAIPRWMQLRNAAERLADDDLNALLDALKAERRAAVRQLCACYAQGLGRGHKTERGTRGLSKPDARRSRHGQAHAVPGRGHKRDDATKSLSQPGAALGGGCS